MLPPCHKAHNAISGVVLIKSGANDCLPLCCCLQPLSAAIKAVGLSWHPVSTHNMGRVSVTGTACSECSPAVTQTGSEIDTWEPAQYWQAAVAGPKSLGAAAEPLLSSCSSAQQDHATLAEAAAADGRNAVSAMMHFFPQRIYYSPTKNHFLLRRPSLFPHLSKYCSDKTPNLS